MSQLLIHDGRRPGHHSWTVSAIGAGAATGAFLSPFTTPRVAAPRYLSGAEFAQKVVDAGGELVFDPMTHARLLPGSDKTDHYDTWELWGGDGVGLDTATRRAQHVERVFIRQSDLGVHRLAPTVAVDGPGSDTATWALETASLARGIDERTWQSFAATRGFLRSGVALDSHVGRLAELRAGTWVVTVVNELVTEQAPDLTDHAAFAGLLRAVHSLSQRSRVIIAFSDFSGLLAVAAGADTVGSGWDRGMRTFDPASFHVASDAGIRIPASYVTQRGLSAVLRRDTADAIERWDSAQAARIRGGAMPPSDPAERLHHLQSVRSLTALVAGQPDRAARVAALRAHYESGLADFATLIRDVAPLTRDRVAWLDHHHEILRDYADAEGLWAV